MCLGVVLGGGIGGGGASRLLLLVVAAARAENTLHRHILIPNSTSACTTTLTPTPMSPLVRHYPALHTRTQLRTAMTAQLRSIVSMVALAVLGVVGV